MSRIDNILNMFGLEPTPEVKANTLSVTSPSWHIGNSLFDVEGPDHNVSSYEDLARRFTISDLNYMCGTRLGDMAGTSELLLFPADAEIDPETGKPDISEAIPRGKHPFYALLDRPNPHTTRFEWLKQVTLTTLLSNRGSFVHIDDGKREENKQFMGAIASPEVEISISGEPVALWTLLPHTVEKKDSKDKLVDHFIMDKGVGQPKVKFDPKCIMWLKEFNPVDFMGSLSRMVPSQMATDFDMAAKTANTMLFKNGLHPGAIVEADRDNIDPVMFAMMQKLWEEQLKGVDNWYRILPLWGGFKLNPSQGFTPADAQFIEGTEQATARVFGVWGVHPGIVFVNDVNKANAQVADYVTRKFTLEPLLNRIATAMTLYILPLYNKGKGKQAVAHFVNVVPRDEQVIAGVEAQKSATALRNAQDTQVWVTLLGKKEGIEESKRVGLVSDEVTGKDISEEQQQQQQQQGMQPEVEELPPVGGTGKASSSLMAVGPNGKQAKKSLQVGSGAEVSTDVEIDVFSEIQSLTNQQRMQQMLMTKLIVDGAFTRDFAPAEETKEQFGFSVTDKDMEELERFWDANFPEYAGLMSAENKLKE